MSKPKITAEDKIRLVTERLTGEQVDALIEQVDALVEERGKDAPEFRIIAEAVMAWYQLLMASGVVKRGNRAIDTLAGSMLVLGTLVKYTYALGVRRGRRLERREGKNA